MKITKKGLKTLFKSLAFSVSYAFFSAVTVLCFLYPYDPKWFEGEDWFVLNSSVLSTLCTVFHIIGVISFIVLLVIAVLNFNAYYNSKNVFTRSHLLLEFVLFLLFFFPLWRYGELIFKSYWNTFR